MLRVDLFKLITQLIEGALLGSSLSFDLVDLSLYLSQLSANFSFDGSVAEAGLFLIPSELGGCVKDLPARHIIKKLFVSQVERRLLLLQFSGILLQDRVLLDSVPSKQHTTPKPHEIYLYIYVDILNIFKIE